MDKLTAYLMFRDRAFDPQAKRCSSYGFLNADFAMDRVIGAMARGDGVIYDVCAAALFTPLRTAEEIAFRQAVLEDARKNAGAVRRMYDIFLELAEITTLTRGHAQGSPAKLYSFGVNIVNLHLDLLKKLREAADADRAGFTSEPMKSLYTMLINELSDEFFGETRQWLSRLPDAKEVLITAAMNDDLVSVRCALCNKVAGASRLIWTVTPTIDMTENTASTAAADWDRRRNRALSETADVLVCAARYMGAFFVMLRHELAFYIGCLNLEDTLQSLGMPVCVPKLRPAGSYSRTYRGLYDAALVLTSRKTAVGNDAETEDIKLYIVTGANQGGKSTFLRSVGQAQLMAQCGMSAGAEVCEIPLRRSVYSHFKREEDRGMQSGKLDEEMRRMSEIIDFMEPGSLVLMNESFSSTNEREGSEICRMVTRAFTRHGIEVFSVSHLYAYASSFIGGEDVFFMRAQRSGGGARAFKLEPGEPRSTAFGKDLYERIFGGAGA